MSIKSNIVTLKNWLSEKVKETYLDKEQIIFEKPKENTKKIVISKQIANTNLTNQV
jgi:hypothetical protein